MSVGGTNVSDEEPPLTIVAVLNLAWSLILNLSGNEKDIDIGKEVLKNLNKFQTHRIEKPSSTKGSTYLNNVFCLLFGFVESIAFERYFYYQYYHTQEKIRMQTINYWNDLADMASFSKDGTILRIAGFLGVGGGANVLRNLISNGGISATTSYDIGIFLLFGFIGLVGIVIMVKYLRTWQIRETVSSTLGAEQDYWQSTARKNYKKNLEELYRNIERIQKRYYPNYKEELAGEKLDDIIDQILPQTKLFEVSNKDKKRQIIR
jgi:hypothetical protein